MKVDPWWDPLPHRLGSICSLLQCTRLMAAELPRRGGLLRPGNTHGGTMPPVYIQQGTADVATRHAYLVKFLAEAAAAGEGRQPLLQCRGSTVLSHDNGDGVGPGGFLDGRGGGGSSIDFTYFEVPGGFHDLNHDKATPECLQRILAWLEEQLRRQQQQ